MKQTFFLLLLSASMSASAETIESLYKEKLMGTEVVLMKGKSGLHMFCSIIQPQHVLDSSKGKLETMASYSTKPNEQFMLLNIPNFDAAKPAALELPNQDLELLPYDNSGYSHSVYGTHNFRVSNKVKTFEKVYATQGLKTVELRYPIDQMAFKVFNRCIDSLGSES